MCVCVRAFCVFVFFFNYMDANIKKSTNNLKDGYRDKWFFLKKIGSSRQKEKKKEKKPHPLPNLR